MGKVKRLVRGAARKTGVARAVRETREAAQKIDRTVAGGKGIRHNVGRVKDELRKGKRKK